MCVWQINLAEIRAIEHGTITYLIFGMKSKPIVISTKVMVIKSQTNQSKSIRAFLFGTYICPYQTAVLCLLKINSQTISGLLLADKFMLKLLNFQRRICPPNLKISRPLTATPSGSVKGQEADFKRNRCLCLSSTPNIEALSISNNKKYIVLCTESKNL